MAGSAPLATFRGHRGQILVLAIALLFLVWANIETPLWGDDYCEAIPVGLTEPFAFAWHDYFTWTGRFFVTAIT